MPDVTMTINADKTMSLSTIYLGCQGEHVDVLVEVDPDVVDLGYQAYVDFLLPSGLRYYKGGYDCSSGSFSMGLGEADSVMDKDGEVLVQFWVGTIVASVKTMHWATAVKRAYVNKSVGATSAAILPYVPQMVYPDTYPAELISIEDSAGRIGASQVEQALSEIVGAGRTTETIKGNATNIATNSTSIGTLTSLTTTEKASLVGAINELVGRWIDTEAYQEVITSIPTNSHVSQQIGAIAKVGYTLIGFLTKCSAGDNVFAGVVEYSGGNYWVHAISKWGAELTNVTIDITAIFLKT